MFTRYRRKFGRARDLARFIYHRRLNGVPPPTDAPWFDREGVEAFKDELAKASSYLEYGSGGSPVLADRAGIPVVIVEADPYFAQAVRSRISGRKVDLLNPNMGLIGFYGTPLLRRRAKSRRYIEAPYPRAPFPDFILIDGRYRVACALSAAKHANEAGRRAMLMFDDYARRRYYHQVEEHLGQPQLRGRAAFFTVGTREVEQSAIDLASGDWR
ncbi:MAG: hypothetical protein ABI626_04920 [Sphingomicrobium sp.]